MTEQKAIGPSFYDELVAYGTANNIALVGEHFTWWADGTIEFFDDTSPEVIAGVEAVYAAHDPTKPSVGQLTDHQTSLMDAADVATAGMADAYVAGLLSTTQTSVFKTWAAYKLALSQVDLTKGNPAWPAVPSN
jgi:hypothetical protein